MEKSQFVSEGRENRTITLDAEFLVVGGGLAGVCAALAAARRGVKVTLVQDRPVLGGNASSEVRLWALGATSHMGNNNRWSREGGIIDEILLDNLHRNKEGNPVFFDTLLLEKVRDEENITLLLNTAVYDVEKSGPKTIRSARAFCSQNSITYILNARYFCDATGDGMLGFAAGAAFRMGAEKSEEFGEKFAPSETYGELLGHTLFFYSKDVGKPVDYVAPSFALKDIASLPKYRSINAKDQGCLLWWVEFGGSLDTVYDSEEIKWELWKIVYGIWDYIKNSGNFPESKTQTLEWVGTIPGKRESRRFEGDYMLKQQDIIEAKQFEDAVSVGGWAIDLHPEDGVYRDLPSCDQWHGKGVYSIPYRCYYSKNLDNLFLAGRIISASHVAFGSSRVMLTCAHGGQAVGAAAAHCLKDGFAPRDLLEPERMIALQNDLNLSGQAIPDLAVSSEGDIARSGNISASGVNDFSELPPSADSWVELNCGVGQWVPWGAGVEYQVSASVYSEENSEIEVRFRLSNRPGQFTPGKLLATRRVSLKSGEQDVFVSCHEKIDTAGYVLVSFHGTKGMRIKTSDVLQTGTVAVFNSGNKAVSSKGEQIPPEGIGVDSFEFWCPRRRPEGQNLALRFDPPLAAYGIEQLKSGFFRPHSSSNAWVAALEDKNPELTIGFDTEVEVTKIDLYFDPDYDHALESVQMGHSERVVPHVVRNCRITDADGRILHEIRDNHQSLCQIVLDPPVKTKQLKVQLEHPSDTTPAALFGLRVYS